MQLPIREALYDCAALVSNLQQYINTHLYAQSQGLKLYNS